MRVLGILAVSLIAFAACSDDPKATDASDTAVAPDTDAADTANDTAADSAVEETADDADVGPTCEHACKSPFGTNDKSLCPVPQADWNCVDFCCVPTFKCQTHEDCMGQGFELGQCTDDRFDCRCDVPSGVCATWYCGVSSDCGDGQSCVGGRCIATHTADGLSIRILDRSTVLTPGATFQLHAEAYDPADSDVVVAAAGATWGSSASGVIAVDANGKLTGGDTEGVATITATLGQKTATLVVENIVPDPTDDLTIILRTELTKEPVTGTYAIVDPVSGDMVLGDLPEDGVLRFPNDGGNRLVPPFDLHVFADENDWVSWLGLPVGSVRYLPIPKAVYGRVEMDPTNAIVPETTTLDQVGVVSGIPELVHYETEGQLELVLTTQGLSSALFDFSLSVLLGADVKRYLDPNHHIPRVDASEPLTLPGGIVFNLAGPAIPSFIETLSKGHHKLWSLGGNLDLNQLAEYSGKIVDAISGGDLDFTQIVGAVFPLFRTFQSGYLPDVDVETVGSTDIQPVTPKLVTPMGIFTDLDVPKMPQVGNLGYADGLFLIAGAETADGFMVGLGLNGGADTSDKTQNPPDGFADGNERTPEKDPFSLPIAPLHSGLQGPYTKYLVAAVAAAIPAGGGDKRPSSGSATLVRWEPGVRPPATQTLPDFLAFPTAPATNKYDPATRTVEFDAVPGADMQRILFKGKHGKHWTFYGVKAGTPLVVPAMDDVEVKGDADRLIDGELESVLINSIDFAPGTDLSTLGVPGGLELDLLLDSVSRVSFIDVKHPIPEAP
ncbi:MAG: hypothetical protein U1F43_13265 [Myxococcota bacterium]